MTSLLIESVLLAFVLVGIVGIAIALSLRSSPAWTGRAKGRRLTAAAPIHGEQGRPHRPR